MYLTSIWSDPADVVTVPETWAQRLLELPALLLATGCTMLRTGCQIVRTVCRKVSLQVRTFYRRASSLTATQAVVRRRSRPHTVLLQAVARGTAQRLSMGRSQRCPLPARRRKPGLPSPVLSRRKHATMRPQPTNHPSRVPPSACADLSHAFVEILNKPQSPRPLRAPSVHRRPPRADGVPTRRRGEAPFVCDTRSPSCEPRGADFRQADANAAPPSPHRPVERYGRRGLRRSPCGSAARSAGLGQGMSGPRPRALEVGRVSRWRARLRASPGRRWRPWCPSRVCGRPTGRSAFRMNGYSSAVRARRGVRVASPRSRG